MHMGVCGSGQGMHVGGVWFRPSNSSAMMLKEHECGRRLNELLDNNFTQGGFQCNTVTQIRNLQFRSNFRWGKTQNLPRQKPFFLWTSQGSNPETLSWGSMRVDVERMAKLLLLGNSNEDVLRLTTAGVIKFTRQQKRPLSSMSAFRTAVFSVSSSKMYMSPTSCMAESNWYCTLVLPDDKWYKGWFKMNV